MGEIEKKDFRQIAEEKDTRFKILSENFISMQTDIERALPAGFKSERMLSIIIATVQKNRDLLECEPSSLFGAFIQTAILGLSPIMGESWIIPYYDKRAVYIDPVSHQKRTGCQVAQFQIGAKGFVTLAYRSNLINTIESVVVYNSDEFELTRGTHPQIKHIPSLSIERIDDDITGAYAIANFNNNMIFEYMTRNEIERIRMRSQSQRKKTSYGYEPSSVPLKIWKSDYAEMCRKTVIIRLGKYLPKEKMDRNLSSAFIADDGIITVDQLGESGKGALPENIQRPEYADGAEINTETGEVTELQQRQIETQKSMREQKPVIKRPYEPEYLKEQMSKSVIKHGKSNPVRDDKLLTRYHSSFSSLKLNESDKKKVQKYLFEVDSSDDLTAAQMIAGVSWIDSHKEITEEGEEWMPNDDSLTEANSILELENENN